MTPPTAPPRLQRQYPVLSRQEVYELIGRGHTITIIDQYVLKVNAWLKYHPGGDKAIMHMVGRDATDEVNALHSPEARAMMGQYRIGRIEGRWTNFIPPIQGGRFDHGEAVSNGERQETRTSNDVIQSKVIGHEARVLGGSGESSVRSGSPSSVFDQDEKIESGLAVTDGGGLRRRVGGRDGFESPLSSAADDGEAEEKLTAAEAKDGPLTDGMAFLESETRKEIRLDVTRYPSLNDETQDYIVREYRALNEQIRAEGLYDCNYSAYAIEIARYSVLAGLSCLFLRWGWYVTSGMFLGFFWHQLVFSAHDAGHMGITHDFQTDTVIGIIIADFLGGLSLGWWKRSHNVHHIVTNSPEHDPDIELMPFFAVSHRFLQSLRSSYYDRVMEYDAAAKLFLAFQSWAYYPILTMGRFNLYRLSWLYLLQGQGPRRGPAWWHRWLEIAGQIFFWAWFGYGVLYRSIPTNASRLVFVLVSHMVTAPLHVQITLSHFAMSTADLGPAESFPQKMLRTTMDVDCPIWLDFFHGGLQFQAVHHLFPRIPRHNLRRTQKLVQDFCRRVEIPYALYGFVDGNRRVVGRLADVSRQVAILAKCQWSILEESGVEAGHG